VSDELSLDISVCVLSLAHTLGMRCELGITVFTHAKHRDIFSSFDDPKSTFRRTQFSIGRTSVVLST
jgi:hypothetical protein